MRVIGLDVCKDSVVTCLLCDARPTEPRQLYHDLEFPKLYANAEGIKQLLALNPDVAVLEPTGVNYSKLWVAKLAAAGVKIALVGHRELRVHRIHLKLPDKDDEADALALACYYLEYCQQPDRFVRIRDEKISQIRDIVLRLHHLARIQSPIVNRVRQDLAWQFPESAKIRLNAPLFWGWLAGLRPSTRYDNLLTRSIGLGLTVETQLAAKSICELQERERILELSMRRLILDPRFNAYRRVFARFGFGQRVEALILSQIYPLENYLLNGKPEIRIRKGKISGKSTKRELSRRRFQKALGVAPTREESGDKKSTRKAGSALCRMALWQWVFTRIEVVRARPKNDIGKKLGEMLDYEKAHKPVKLARSRVAAKAAALLFKELVAALDAEYNQA